MTTYLGDDKDIKKLGRNIKAYKQIHPMCCACGVPFNNTCHFCRLYIPSSWGVQFCERWHVRRYIVK